MWQKRWENQKGRRYFSTQKDSVKTEHCNLGNERRHTVIMTRLRLGYCELAWDLEKIDKHEDGLLKPAGNKQLVHLLWNAVI